MTDVHWESCEKPGDAAPPPMPVALFGWSNGLWRASDVGDVLEIRLCLNPPDGTDSMTGGGTRGGEERST